MGTSNHGKRTCGALTINKPMFEGGDYLMDMEESFPSKRRRSGEPFYNRSDKKVDTNYTKFLDDLQIFWAAKFSDDDEDLSYMLFFENLMEHGNAYMCNVSVENGVLSPIIYEESNHSPTEVKRKTARMCIDNHSRKKWNLKQDGGIKTVRKNSSEENHSRDELKKNLDVADNPKSYVKNSDFGNYHPDGVKGRRRTPVPSRDGCVRENRSLDIDGDERSEKRPEIDEAFGVFMDSLHVNGDDVFFSYGEQKRVYYETSNHQATDIEVEPLETNTRPLTSSMRPSTPVPRPPTPPPRAHISSPKKPTQRDAKNTLTASTHKNKEQLKETISSYRRELRDYLRQPYDKAEYNDLWEFMTARKPVYIHRESRSGGSDRQGHMGKSYLDLYPDLKSEIDKVKSDRRKVLNLLRMFKIYLQKIPSLPSRYIEAWKDDFFKTILPG